MGKRKKRARKENSQVLIIGGLALLVMAIFLLKNSFTAGSPNQATGGNAATQTAAATLPEDQLDLALQAGRPVLAFFHSLTCVPCMQMVSTVEQVYPEFENEVVLVDVDVYDQKNQPLLRRALVRSIPTVVFIDRLGQGQTHIGVLQPAELRDQLTQLAGR